MPSFRYGGKKGKKCSLTESSRHVVIRTENRGALDPNTRSKKAWRLLGKLDLDFQLPGAGVEVHQIRAARVKKPSNTYRFKTIFRAYFRLESVS